MKSPITKLVFTTVATSVFLNVGILGINPVQASQIKDMYVFGDSLVDGGRFSQLINSSFPPSQLGYYQGRFTNGLVFPEVMAQKLGLNYNLANNFAIGGSETGDYHPTGIPGLGLRSQLNGYLNNSKKADKQALYLISSGTNDYRHLDPRDGILNDVQPVVNNLTEAITRLANAGAKNFMVVGVPDLGTIPANVKHDWGTPEETAAALNLLTNLSYLHNQLLAESIQKLNNTLKVDITFFDLDYVLSESIKPNNKFGYTNVTDGCLDISIDAIALGQIPSQPPCSDADKYLFYDWIHPTAAAHKNLADYAIKDLIKKNKTLKNKDIQDEATEQDVYNLAGFGFGDSSDDIEQVPEPANLLGLFTLGIIGAGLILKQTLKKN